MRVRVLLFLAMAFFIAGSAHAQPPAAADPAAAPQDQKTEPAENPSVKAVNDKAAALAKNLSADEIKTLGQVRENFGYLRSIGIALESVEDATKQCGQKNSSMKKEMTSRHKLWAEKIAKAKAAQETSLDAALTEKNFKDPAPVKDYLDAIDAMARDSEKKIEKQVVTTPEACKSLQESMDNTEQVILKILDEMRWPGDTPAKPAEEAKP